MVSLTFPFQFRCRTHSEWTIERHHFQAEYGESLKTIDDDLVLIHESLDDLFAGVVRWTVCVFVRVFLSGSRLIRLATCARAAANAARGWSA